MKQTKKAELPSEWFNSLPKKVQTELQESRLRVRALVSARMLWDRVLTESEKEQLGGDRESAIKQFGGSVGIWRKLHGGTQPRAIIEVAYRLSFLDEHKREWLLQAIGETSDVKDDAARKSKDTPKKPDWDRETGQLRLGETKIRAVRVLKSPSNIQRILDAFEAAGWPKSIDNPLKLGQQQLHQALRMLNSGLKKIRFAAQAGGKSIHWE